MAKIAIDSDGVLCNFSRAFLELINSIWPGRVDPNIEPKHWDDFQGLSREDTKPVWAKLKATENWWMTPPAYSDNVGALAKFLLTHKGHEIHIVTARPETAGMVMAKQTQTWLYLCGVIPNVNYMGVIPCDAKDKAYLYDHLGIQWSVDDKGETVEACDQVKGHTAFLLNRPWNQDAKPKRRISSLDELFSAIEGDPK